MRFDAVIFDLYGTLVDNIDAPGPYQDAYKRAIVEMALFLDAPSYQFAQSWSDSTGLRMTGAHSSAEQYIEYVCSVLGMQPDAEQVAAAHGVRMDLFRSIVGPRPDCVETLARLRGEGFRIGLITDCSWETVLLWPETPLPPYFDATVFSCAVGMRKPDPRIYAIACDQLGLAPERCLYVGDGGSDELAGAERVGMTALRIHVPYETPPDAANPWPGPEVSALAQVLDYVKE